ncbi:MAG: hypothetical protein HGJ93_00675 [Desulfosarcina sp.]|nr:hypothetical protein [Desulfosarcina sp.]MBC2764500.1 hypothetical protein [Desulfosarcina sp.]
MEESKVNWEDFKQSFKSFGKKRMGAFMADPVNIQMFSHAPDYVTAMAFEKCEKYGIEWPVSETNPDADPDAGSPGPPEGERFVCNRHPNYQILVGDKVAQFTNGSFRTDDPEIIAAIVDDPWFNLFIVADNKTLRNLRPKRR